MYVNACVYVVLCTRVYFGAYIFTFVSCIHMYLCVNFVGVSV